MKRLVVAAVLALSAASSMGQSCTPFKDVDGTRVMVPVKFNGVGPYYLLLDTGSPVTVIDVSIFQKIGAAKSDAAMTLVVAGNKQSAFRSQVSTIQVSDKLRGSFDVQVYPLDAETKNTFGVIGIIGQDFLKNYTVTIDNRHSCLILQ
jgi:Aspartyl protease